MNIQKDQEITMNWPRQGEAEPTVLSVGEALSLGRPAKK